VTFLRLSRRYIINYSETSKKFFLPSRKVQTIYLLDNSEKMKKKINGGAKGGDRKRKPWYSAAAPGTKLIPNSYLK
jgi:hypothetical protein